jgi:hypothetical protein
MDYNGTQFNLEIIRGIIVVFILIRNDNIQSTAVCLKW